ncbi:hypothetical protein [Caulobacter sp. B11]|uniref:hypothetical protein n=1 Tax=Caulobacter sp. B11 TaxID=2048899 RepID=UPI00191BA45A|nr:hypothetical protein [Caulobacter sp. B11]
MAAACLLMATVAHAAALMDLRIALNTIIMNPEYLEHGRRLRPAVGRGLGIAPAWPIIIPPGGLSTPMVAA